MATTTEERARQSLGASHTAIYAMVARVVSELGIAGGSLLDVGCGHGQLWLFLSSYFARYAGIDILHYEGFPENGCFTPVDLEAGEIPLPEGAFDVVAAVETIEHLENPRQFFRALTPLIKPGGWLIVTTPNQLNLTSLLFLALKGEFSYFQEVSGMYPAHLSALLEIDLTRMAREQELVEPRIHYSNCGRIPLTARHWPWPLRGQRFSDNILMIARRPAAPGDDIP